MYDELIKALHDGAEFLECSTSGIKNSFAKMCHNAADAIEELSRLNAEITRRELKLRMEKPRWIPVTERLIHSGWYLVACNEWGGSAVRKAIYDEATRKWLEFPCGGPKDITKFVTHYMPPTEPPKEV